MVNKDKNSSSSLVFKPTFQFFNLEISVKNLELKISKFSVSLICDWISRLRVIEICTLDCWRIRKRIYLSTGPML